MSDTQQSEPTHDDLLRTVSRDRFVKEQMAVRIASLIQENLELVGIIRDLQSQQAPTNGDAPQTKLVTTVPSPAEMSSSS